MLQSVGQTDTNQQKHKLIYRPLSISIHGDSSYYIVGGLSEPKSFRAFMYRHHEPIIQLLFALIL